jgi:hypothetical protein
VKAVASTRERVHTSFRVRRGAVDVVRHQYREEPQVAGLCVRSHLNPDRIGRIYVAATQQDAARHMTTTTHLQIGYAGAGAGAREGAAATHAVAGN